MTKINLDQTTGTFYGTKSLASTLYTALMIFSLAVVFALVSTATLNAQKVKLQPTLMNSSADCLLKIIVEKELDPATCCMTITITNLECNPHASV